MKKTSQFEESNNLIEKVQLDLSAQEEQLFRCWLEMQEI